MYTEMYDRHPFLWRLGRAPPSATARLAVLPGGDYDAQTFRIIINLPVGGQEGYPV